MNFFKKFISGITGYLVLYGEVTREIGGVTADFFKTRWGRLRTLPASEQAFALLTGIVIIFTFLPWRGYRIQFGADPERRHGIYSDDFGIILIGCVLAALSLIWHILPQEPRHLKRTPFYRFGGILIVALFAAWNWVNPARIAPTTEAAFTWSFYAFQALAVVWIIAGVLGARYYAQYPERN